MRTFVVDRKSLQSSELLLPNGDAIQPAGVVAVLDRLGVPDGFPFVTDDDGSPLGCLSINTYLFEAWKQRGLDLRSMRRFHIYNLARVLRFIRRERMRLRALEFDLTAETAISAFGELKVDLIEATRSELVNYKLSRSARSSTTVATELGSVSAFFRFAKSAGWIAVDPVPRWGRNQRNTLMPNIRRKRSPKFLSARQTRHFLEAGLRGDGCPTNSAPAFPERDYFYGLLLATTGMRREEAANLLDCELPRTSKFPTDGIHAFDRAGKYNFSRTVYFPQEAGSSLDLYRDSERGGIVLRAQPALRRLLNSGFLEPVCRLIEDRGVVHCDFGREVLRVEMLDNERRRRAVRIQDDGLIDPLGLFLGRGGLPLSLGYWNDLFADARGRVAFGEPLDVPPRHIKVVPHTMRHTFAVRMLAALMREGRERQNDPYAFLTSPLLTVMQLLGHANMETTLDYLYAAERWTEELPNAFRSSALRLVAQEPTNRGSSFEIPVP
jgi:integrase